MAYVDGFVVPVPKKKLEAYRRMARAAGKVWREYGALQYVECVADDVKPGKHTSFPQSVKLKAGARIPPARLGCVEVRPVWDYGTPELARPGAPDEVSLP